jgi:hypothetical protein
LCAAINFTMLNNILKKYSIGAVVLLGTLFILFFYGKYIFNPNGYLFSGGGDGVKNYYTFGWHVQYDSSYTHFEGMNYPYGEHIVFTDNQPLFSNILKWVNGTGINVGAYSVGIVNLLMFVGLLLAFILLYKLFFAFTGANLFSITAAISVGLLSPQVIRITEHFALAYCFVIPLFIWLIYKFFKQPSWRQSAVIGLALLLLLYIHLYYIVIIGGMLLALWLVFLIHKQTGLGFFKSVVHIGVQVIIPLAIYFIWLKATDTIADRPTEPFGMVEFAAHWEGLLLPMGFEYFKPIENALHIREISSESFSYAGLPVLLFVVISLITGIIKLFKKKQKPESTNVVERPFEKMFITALLIASVLVFCYAAFSPLLFKIEALAQYLGLLKQFRSLGRLLWVPFYALNIFVAVYLFNKYKNSPKLKFIPWLVPLLIFVDAALLNIRVAKRLDLPKPNISWIPTNINPQNYRAIIPLPFFHEGSENVDVKTANNYIVEQSLLASWHTGIPLEAVKMSRTSISQTLAQAELGFEFTLLPEVLSNDTTRSYLLLVDDNQAVYLPEIAQLQPIASHNTITLYSITKNKLKQFLDGRAAKALHEAQTIEREVIEATYNSFDTLPSQQVYMGKGALTIPPKQTEALYNETCHFCNDSVTVSFWLYANMEGIAQPKLLITSGGELERVQPVYHIKAVSRQWALIEYKFLPKGKELKIEVMKEADVQTQPMYVDEFLLRRHDFYTYNDSFVMKNDRFYQLPR